MPKSSRKSQKIKKEDIFAKLSTNTFEKANDSSYIKSFSKGISEKLIKKISKEKKEEKWMLDYRLKAYKEFQTIPLPKWGPNLSQLDFDEICYFARASKKNSNYKSWEAMPSQIKSTFDKLGIPQAEQKILAGVGAQYESEVIYHSLEKELEEKGVIFLDMDIALKKHPKLVKKYFGKCIPSNDHKFAALHGAIWSGGSFLYVPKNLKIEKPLQAYFRMNAKNMGQFEHTIIIIDEGAEAHYIEGCSSPKYGSTSLHAGSVEIFGITMLYPASILKGDNASTYHLGIAFANKGQIQDTGAKVYHLGKNTHSKIITKSISKNGGKSIYRGTVYIAKNAENSINKVDCDALILDEKSKSNSIPNIQVKNNSSSINHEARVGPLNEEDIFYLNSRGIPTEEAEAMIVNGFINPIVRQLPLEYAIEMNRLIELEMKNSIG